MQARDCKGTIHLRKDFQKTWKRQGWGEGKWGKWKDDGIIFSYKTGAERSGKWLLSSRNQNPRVSEENTEEYQHRKWKAKTFHSFRAFTIPKHPDFLYPNGCHISPCLSWSVHQQRSFIRRCSIPFTYKMEESTGQRLLSPCVWNAAPLGSVAELWLSVCNEGQSGLVIPAGEAGRWARRASCASSHTRLSLCTVGTPPASPTGLSPRLINVCRQF